MPQLSHRRQLLVLGICCMSLLIVAMDNTIVNIALPAIRSDLHASLSGLQWTVDAYLLVLASLLMLSGSTADRLGRKRTFLTGLTLFTVSSLLCSIAPGLGWLVAFRALQAVGGSMLNPVAMSIITNVFTDARERAWAIGVWGGVIGISMGLGPVVGGVLTESVGWRSIFWVNVPIGVAAFVLTTLFVPESKAAHPRRVDPVGQVLIAVLFGGLVYAIIEAPRAGWLSGRTGITLLVVAISLLVFVRYELRCREPLVDLRFFRSVPLSGATVIAVCAFGAFGGYLFLNTLYLQDVRGYSALRAGLCTLPLAVVVGVMGPVAGRLVGHRGPRSSLLVSGVAICAAAGMLVTLRADTSLGWVIGSYLLFGVGFGMVNPPITNSAVAGMPRSQAGVASAVASTSRQVGSALGVAVAGSVLSSGLSGGTLARGFVTASHPAWLIIAACGAVLVPLGLLVTGPWARATITRTAYLFGDETDASQRPPASRPAPAPGR